MEHCESHNAVWGAGAVQGAIVKISATALVLAVPLLALGCADDGASDARLPPDTARAAAAADSPAPRAAAAADTAGRRAAIAVVERFGERLARVSLLAPDTAVRQQIRAEYGPLVTPPLLESWIRDLSNTPGRVVSSPWPQRIEVQSVRRIRTGTYEVVGDVIYVTSVEGAAGRAARRERVVATVLVDEQGRAHIDGYEGP